MTLQPDQHLELIVEKPAAGGRMIARHEGRILFVHGAIPGERVRVRIRRVEKQLAFADAVDVLAPSPDRREPHVDLLCGGCLYSHIAYPRQLTLKAEVIQDAFLRLGRMSVPGPLRVAASPEQGYRMRARLHVRAGRVGFYREGTHDLCDARRTGQLSDAAIDAAELAVGALSRAGCAISSAELTENIAADQRVVHVTAVEGADVTDALLDRAVEAAGLTGCTGTSARGTLRTSGVPVVADPVSRLTAGRATSQLLLQRHADSFFQGNRYLLPDLVGRVLDAVLDEGEVLDLYAGVGLFAVTLAATGRRGITAVEADRSGARDLQLNASSAGGAVRVNAGRVEDYLRRHRGAAASTVIVDPPRTGISRDAIQAVAAHGSKRIVYVSCDPATMARDARRVVDAGYTLSALEAFDLFPNTPHVEMVGLFDRAA